MTVAGEIKIAIRTEGGEHLVARGVDGRPQILHRARFGSAQQAAAPDINSAHAATHIADEIQPLSIGTHSGVGETAGGIAGDDKLLRFAPGGIATFRHHDTGVTRVGGVGLALGKVHRLAIGREAAGTLVEGRVKLRGYHLRLAPFALLILLGIEDVGTLGACDAIDFVALRLIAGRGEVKLVVGIAS